MESIGVAAEVPAGAVYVHSVIAIHAIDQGNARSSRETISHGAISVDTHGEQD
jgi:hypothetical protein